ncbi:hypothetical protein [Lawsonia intracellularis]|uniref:hypothetical protein n=1 Tax=Lawsonia intracellularis TaxID=29546 RepID=UPI0021E5B83C|nr:hypothetical protein [Lawsonia intracellularis]UYH52776.1 hypothetical protein OCT60_05705 [Lawsonia intracellularis]
MEINPIPIGSINILTTQSLTESQSTEEAKIEQQKSSQSKYVLRTKGIPRIALAFLSFGITEVVRAVQSYQAKRIISQEPRLSTEFDPSLFKNKTERYNARLLKTVFEDTPNTSTSDVLKNAIKKVEKELEQSSIRKNPDAQPIIKRAYQQLWLTPNKQHKLTEEELSTIISKEIKNILIKEQVIKELETELDTRGVKYDQGSLAVLLQRKAKTIEGLCYYSNERLSQELTSIVIKVANLAESLQNYGKAKREIKQLYLEVKGIDINSQEAMQDTELRKLLLAIDEKAEQYEARETSRNGGEMPVIPIGAYRYIFTQTAEPFFDTLETQHT